MDEFGVSVCDCVNGGGCCVYGGGWVWPYIGNKRTWPILNVYRKLCSIVESDARTETTPSGSKSDFNSDTMPRKKSYTVTYYT